MRRQKLNAGALAVGLTLLLVGPAANAQTVTDLGTLGGTSSMAYGISNSGIIVGQAMNAAGNWHAFRTAPLSTITPATDDLGTLGGRQSYAFGVNDNGQVIGYSDLSGGGDHAFFYNGSTLQDTGIGVQSYGYGINATGQFVGYASDAQRHAHAFLNSAVGSGAFIKNTLGGSDAQAYGLNASGQVVGSATNGSGYGRAFLYPDKSGNMVDLGAVIGTLGKNVSVARAINASGTVVGFFQSAAGPTHAFVWVPSTPNGLSGTVQDLKTLTANGTSEALGINQMGVIVGKATASDGSTHAVSWSPSAKGQYQIADLNTPGSGWTLTEADAINNMGQIVGNGVIASHTHAYLIVPSTLPLLNLSEATTLDAQSVTIDYMISQANISQPLELDFYRSDQQPGPSAIFHSIGTQTLSPTDVDRNGAPALNIGSHTITLIAGTSLPPDPAFPYVVVVANGNSAINEDPASVNTAYFHKFLLGVIAHGYDLLAKFHLFGTPSWMNTMANDLITYCLFDEVIPFNWETQCAVAKSGQATSAGDRLYNQWVAPTVLQLAGKHEGDVVDIHFFGHSRGAVVVSQALQDSVGNFPGSYIEVTLLDPHPANNGDGIYFNNSLTGNLFLGTYQDFQTAAVDPEIRIPSNANVMAIDVFFQKNLASGFPVRSPESILNLWGEDPNDGTITNETNITIQRNDLTNVNAKGVGLIGHTEIQVEPHNIGVSFGRS
jgi:probable HAF family extracellular repeat protein